MPATTTKKVFSRETEVALDIHAKPEDVWALLVNAADYPKWNSTVTSLDGRIAVGEKIRLKSILDEKRTFTLKVLELEAPTRMVWGDAMGKRTYLVTPKDASTVTFSMRERIGGPFFPLFAGMIPPFDAVFDKFAADLKKKAEGAS
ncbi:MAG TPA: SRPBCC domain-containing protein [Polyangiaceae bacterium]|jgi:uncharacterized protein YndB with AHSA1/START domain